MNIGIGYDALNGGTTTGDNNIAIGVSAGDALTSGYGNIFMGEDAGGAATTSLNNIAIGPNALDAATTGLHSNVAIGPNAMGATTGADFVVAIGNNTCGGGNLTSDADGTTAIGAYALDIDGLNKNVLRGDFVRKPHGLGVGQGNFSNQELKPLPFEPKKAIAEFEKAGFTTVGSDGIRLNDKKQRLSFAFTYSHQVVTPRLAYLKEQAKLAGLEIKMNLIDGSSAFKYALEKKHDVSFHSMGTAPQPQYWEYFHSANAGKVQNNNFTNFSTPELDQLIMHFRNALSTQDKERYSRQIQAVVHNATVVIPGLMAPYTREAYWRWMKYPEQPMQKKTQMLFTHGGLRDLGVYWIDNDVKKETKAAVKKDHSFGSKTVIDDKYKPN